MGKLFKEWFLNKVHTPNLYFKWEIQAFFLKTYHGTTAEMTPKTNIVTDAPQIAVLRPNLSDTRPEQKDPRAKPIE